jgi:hypothetical protein
MLSQPLLAAAITYIFAKMRTIHNSKVGAWQRQFLSELMRALFAMRGRVNFTNLARYSVFCEQTFRRHFRKAFDWVAFNLVIFRLRRHPVEPLIGAFDCTFLPKSGKKTWGLGHFFSSATGKNKRGLEVSILGAITTKSGEPVGLDATQTPSISAGEKDGYSRVDFYCEQLLDLAPRLRKAGLPIDHWVGDGYYAKKKVLEAIGAVGADLITRLRSDANLRHLHRAGLPGAGWGTEEPGDKIDWNAPDGLRRGFDQIGCLADKPEIQVLTTLAYSPHFDRALRIVLLATTDFSEQVVLCSTDTSQPAEQIAEYYRLRYQLEFVIRDAKQHTGLTHCQARSEEKIDFHLNMSVAAVGLLRLLAKKKGCSLPTYRREAYNRMLINRLFSKLGLSAEFDRADPRIEEVVRIGHMAV